MYQKSHAFCLFRICQIFGQNLFKNSKVRGTVTLTEFLQIRFERPQGLRHELTRSWRSKVTLTSNSFHPSYFRSIRATLQECSQGTSPNLTVTSSQYSSISWLDCAGQRSLWPILDHNVRVQALPMTKLYTKNNWHESNICLSSLSRYQVSWRLLYMVLLWRLTVRLTDTWGSSLWASYF